MGQDNDSSPEQHVRIDLLSDTDVAYWCRVLDVDHRELRRAVQQVGPRADAVVRCLGAKRASKEYDTGF
jgi:formyltetrahydrofolate synthetase